MPKKKPKPPPSDRHSLHIRLNAEEHAAVQADCRAMPGIPVSEGQYAKHAVLSYPKLRKLEAMVRNLVSNGAAVVGGDYRTPAEAATELLTEVGL